MTDRNEALPKSPLRHYFSQRSSMRIRTNDLPLEPNAHGFYSPAGFFFIFIGLTVPFAYIYILLILFRELCINFPETFYQPLQNYIPWLANVVSTMQQSSIFVEAWCVIEAIFYVYLKLRLSWLQHQDVLEASLRSAPMLELDERQELWDRMMETEQKEPGAFISGWFFDEPIEAISLHDVRDFCAWSMFEGRNLEHLTSEESEQLDRFVEDYEYKISVHLYGLEEKNEEEQKENGIIDSKYEMEGHVLAKRPKTTDVGESTTVIDGRPPPKQYFRFHETSHDEHTSFFTNMYEDFKHRYEQYKNRLENSEFHPVQDLRNFMAGTRQHIVDAEESAVATATNMAETASNMAENAYHTIVAPGSAVDKQLSAIGHATHVQLTEAWNSVKDMRERMETAEFLSSQRNAIRQRLKGYQLLLKQMRQMSSAMPSKQMAVIMRKITECNENMERLEVSARDAFFNATGFARKNLWQRREPQRYAKYSSDPLLGICTYPLGFHLLILAFTEGGLRFMMNRRGFVRLSEGPVNYYYHPGKPSLGNREEATDKTPVVFVHGIGIGLIYYIPLIDRLLETGQPVFLPEIPYVTGFRPWQSPNSVLPPAVVVSTLTGMLATHGFLRGLFAGHSYGTSWLSYMCKYAPDAVAGVVFLDPICFCLHIPRLTKKFVYHRADPGVISYMIRTDMIINCTIQRSFPWARIVLFSEQIKAPCCVFLSAQDELCPALKVEEYLGSKGAPVKDSVDADPDHFATDLNVTVFRGMGHGDWSERAPDVSLVADCVNVMCNRLEVNAITEKNRET